MRIPDKFKKPLESKEELKKTSYAFKPFLDLKGETSQNSSQKATHRKKMVRGPYRKYSDLKLLRILKVEAKRINSTPTSSYFDSSKDLPSSVTYIKRWGSWNNAIKAAGLRPNIEIHRRSEEKPLNHKLDDFSHNHLKRFQEAILEATLSNKEIDGRVLIPKLGRQLGLESKQIDLAQEIYQCASEEGLQKGRTMESVASSVIYLSCRKTGKPFSLNMIAKTANISASQLMKTAKSIRRRLKLKTNPVEPLRALEWVAKKLKLEDEIISLAKSILTNPSIREYSFGKNPFSIVAAAIYMSGIELGTMQIVTQRELAEVADVTTVTIRNRYKEMTKLVKLKMLL